MNVPSITLAPAYPADGISSHVLFGRRFMQEDMKMKSVERAWRTAAMPTLPLTFTIALIRLKDM
jgi:hypothetical protein